MCAESLAQKEALIRSTMEEKKCLVADILNIPLQDYDTIAEVRAPPAACCTEIVLIRQISTGVTTIV